MQNNTNKGGNPKPQQQQQITRTDRKRFRNVALQSTIFASYQDPATAIAAPAPRRTVNTQTIGGKLGVTSSTSTSDLRAAGPPQRYVRGLGPRLVGKNPNPAPGGPIRPNNITGQAPPTQIPLPIGQSQNVPVSVDAGVGISSFAPGQPRTPIKVQQPYAQPLPLFPIPAPLQPQTQNFVRAQPMQVQQAQAQQIPLPVQPPTQNFVRAQPNQVQQAQPQQIPIPPPVQPQTQNFNGIPLEQNQGFGVGVTPFAPGGPAAEEYGRPPKVHIKMTRIRVTNSNGNPVKQELPDEWLQNLNEIYENLHLGHLPLTDDGHFQPFESMFEDVPPKCPEGYEVLLDTENVFVEHADVDNADAFLNVHNKYDVLNTFGDRIYSSAELLNNLSRPDCAGAQNFKLSISSCSGGEIFTLKGQNFTAKLRNRKKQLIGSIKTRWRCCESYASYLVKDKNGRIIYQLFHEMGNQNIYDYEVFDQQMVKIGRLSKTWIGLPNPDQELPYSYGISFPVETDVQEKALLMGAMFVAYFQFFEDTQRERRLNRSVVCCGTMCIIFFVLLMIGLAFAAAYAIMK